MFYVLGTSMGQPLDRAERVRNELTHICVETKFSESNGTNLAGFTIATFFIFSPATITDTIAPSRAWNALAI